jgi:hypothetical protein
LSSRLSELQPWFEPWARWLISAWPYGILTSTYRTFDEQRTLYNAYLNGSSKYPAAPPGHSYHQFGRAFDYVADPMILAQLGALWESVGGSWGGRAGDDIHFEA